MTNDQILERNLRLESLIWNYVSANVDDILEEVDFADGETAVKDINDLIEAKRKAIDTIAAMLEIRL